MAARKKSPPKKKPIKRGKKKILPRKVQKPKKKLNRRAQARFPALEKKFNLPSRQGQLDMDYIGKLNDSEKAWLNKFIEEEVNASFRHSKPFNKTKKQRKASYDRNNARNRDILTRNQTIGNVEDIMAVKEVSQLNPEQILIGMQEKELEEVKQLNKFNDAFNSTKNGKDSAKKKH